jgi:hypothetical protein
MVRGATPGVVRAVTGEERPLTKDAAYCPMCGNEIDFTQGDPLGMGRTMQRCTNRLCPDHVVRTMPLRRM